ncbi:DUF262 and DUF1524 domain-containing protein [Kyrpidia tusciae]|uniref:DUF262 domain-containing protein n=1 Tax=Kyrpidia tusciae (strain DSM 2912 / NBRC 15312 / T2) TaxID=562970 RepID=D5WRU0_KYRT2|nr:DUF262 and DUF1524 domain-containing protein [Kyrpidia tusciae]ADG06892.1 protein of unknown function DUF262 [Kyrpidia tusciae DSM 2912]
MKAQEANLLAFLQGPKQFVVPIFQRNYSWTRRQCEQLWQDIVQVGKHPGMGGHFLGSVVYVERGLYHVSSVPRLMVIDGQQRLTSITLLLAALADVVEASGASAEVNPRRIRHYYLFNSEEEGEMRYKLLLTRRDRDTLKAVLEYRELPREASERIKENYAYFRDQLEKGSIEPQTVFDGISRLFIVDIALDREHDNPQLIFESLNSTGLDLSQTDLIRNYILMGLEANEQEALYERYWYPMEQRFILHDEDGTFDRFIRDFLTVKTGVIPKIGGVYEFFKNWHRQSGATVTDILQELHHYSRYYLYLIAPQTVDNPQLRSLLSDIRQLRVDVAYPLLMAAFEDYDRQLLTLEELCRVLQWVESYVFRRAVCGIPTNSLNTTFAQLIREVDKENYLESLQIALLTKESYRRFPSDEEFVEQLKIKDLYHFRSRMYFFRKLENFDRKEPVVVENYSIEHIMPQNPNLSDEWKKELGERWKEISAQYLHTLGNLTLTGYNPELSDRPFREKRDMKGGFAESPLRLNRSLARLDAWNEAAIVARAEELAALAVKVWPRPDVDLRRFGFGLEPRVKLKDVFAREGDLETARALVQELVSRLDDETVDRLLSISYRPGRISVNVGQWLLLRFSRSGDRLLVSLTVCAESCNLDGISPEERERFAERWSSGRTWELVTLSWDKVRALPEDVRRAWHEAVDHARRTFSSWKGSTYRRFHQEDLEAELLEAREGDRDADYAEHLKGRVKEIFEQFRTRILQLDSSIREEYKKTYIAYRTTSNFVEVVPQKDRLKLYLDIRPADLDDPGNLARDVSGIGHRGTGDVEVCLDTVEKLGEVMELVEQAYEMHS